MSDRPERDAFRAECERLGFRCPSCGKNPVDLLSGHRLTFSGVNLPASMPDGTAKCADGELIQLADASFDTVKWLANIDMLDYFGREMDEAMGWPL